MAEKTRRDAYQEVTDRIIAALDAGTVPWRKPWSAVATGDVLQNAVTHKAYRGINPLLLGMTAASAGYSDPRWLTFKQAQSRGGTVRRGEHGTQIVFWRILKKEEEKSDGTLGTASIPMLRLYTVFNAAQCDGLDLKPLAPRGVAFDPIESAEAVIRDYLARGPILSHKGGDRAFYSPALDAIALPAREAFASADGYYATAFHELGHSTGHVTRLDRFKVDQPAHFGSPIYSAEELVAEFTSAMVSAQTGIDPAQQEQSASYIASWLRALRDDRKLAIHAAAKAQRAADLILGTTFSDESEAE